MVSNVKISQFFENLTLHDSPVATNNLPDVINSFLVSVGEDIQPLNSSRLDELRNNLHDCPDRYIISEYAVYYALSQLNVSKSTGPDLIENKLLKKSCRCVSCACLFAY